MHFAHLVLDSFRNLFSTVSNASQSTLSNVSLDQLFLSRMHVAKFSPCVASLSSVRMLDVMRLPFTVIVALAAGR